MATQLNKGKTMKAKLFVAAISLISSAAFAGECAISITRTACPGKETEAFKPYNGKTTTEEKKDVADAAACIAMADKTVKIVRKGTLGKKVIKGTFAGADLGKTFEDVKDCK